jgi:hypothetical protein
MSQTSGSGASASAGGRYGTARAPNPGASVACPMPSLDAPLVFPGMIIVGAPIGEAPA